MIPLNGSYYLSSKRFGFLNPIMTAASKMPDYFGYIFLAKATCRKYLKESCFLEFYLQLSLKYFADSCFIPKLFLNSYLLMTIVLIFRSIYTLMYQDNLLKIGRMVSKSL